MSETGQVEFYIEVNAVDITEEELDFITRQYLAELRETDVEAVELSKSRSASSDFYSTLYTNTAKSFMTASPYAECVHPGWEWLLSRNFLQLDI